jgi:hypothetical protein
MLVMLDGGMRIGKLRRPASRPQRDNSDADSRRSSTSSQSDDRDGPVYPGAAIQSPFDQHVI